MADSRFELAPPCLACTTEITRGLAAAKFRLPYHSVSPLSLRREPDLQHSIDCIARFDYSWVGPALKERK